MKKITKLLIIILVSICFSINGISGLEAQNVKSPIVGSNEVNDSLKAQIIKLEKQIEQGSYTRIPNEDFENIIDNKIQKSMRDTVNWWLFVIAALFSVLGFLVNKYAKAYLQAIIDDKVNNLKKESEEKIKSISNHYFSSVIESLLDFKIDMITKKNNKIDETVVDDLKSYLSDENMIINEQKKVFLIDIIMRCYYYNNYPQRIEKMIDLIREYEEKFTLIETTYANAAIAFSGMYDRYGTKDFLISAIENCNKSIKILPDYGLAFAQKIELCIMAISKAFDDTEKKQYKNELLKVFKDIENNTSTYLCTELIDRLAIDKNSYLGSYLDKLYDEYPDEMAKIVARSTSASKPINPADNHTN